MYLTIVHWRTCMLSKYQQFLVCFMNVVPMFLKEECTVAVGIGMYAEVLNTVL